MPPQRTKGVDSARRVLQILLQFNQTKPELTVEDIVDAHDISLPSAYRYLALLREMFLIEERGRNSYVLSPEILQLAETAERTLDYRLEAQPILNRLQTEIDETSLYLRQLNSAAVCLAISRSDHAINISFEPGHVMPLHAGAGAKILLAGIQRVKQEQYLDRLDPPLTGVGRTRLLAELDRIQEKGFAVSEGEVDEGVWAYASSVSSRGQLVGALSVVAPAYRVNARKRREIGIAVQNRAAELEAALAGAQPRS